MSGNKKPLMIQWKFGPETVWLSVGMYENHSLKIDLVTEIEEGTTLPFTELTKQVPGETLRYNEAYLSDNSTFKKLCFVSDNRLGVAIPGKNGHTLVVFDIDRISECDPVGTFRYLNHR